MAEIRRMATRPPHSGLNKEHEITEDHNEHPIVQDLEGGTNLAMIESVALGAGTFGAIQILKPRVEAIARLPNSARTLLTVGPPVLWYLYSNVASSRNSKKLRHHATHSVPQGTATFTQGADMQHQRNDLQLSMAARTSMWVTDNPVRSIATVGGPLAAYGLYVSQKYPNMPFTQRVMKSSLLGQVSVLSALGLVAAFSYNYVPESQNAKQTLRRHMTTRQASQQQQPQEATH